MQDDDFGGDFSSKRSGINFWSFLWANGYFYCYLRCCECDSGAKRSFTDLDDDEDDFFGSKKVDFPYLLVWVFDLLSQFMYPYKVPKKKKKVSILLF
mgnify:FL=1